MPQTAREVARMMERSLRASPMFFGPPERQLFGLLHRVAANDATRSAVLLCRPFGQESIRAQRAFRVLAERLARAGHHTLRFDYFGTGDADGDDDQVSLTGLCSDIAVADERVRAGAADRHVAWLGLGLGATAAWLAAARAAHPPRYLLLWDPVLDGSDYLAALRLRHRQLLHDALAVGAGKVPRAADIIEVNGFAISAEFESDLAALTVDAMPQLPAGVRTGLLTTPELSQQARQLTRSRASEPPMQHFELPQEMDWMAEDSEDGVLVPAKALQKLLALAGECR